MVHNTVVCMFKTCYWTWVIKHNQTRSRIFWFRLFYFYFYKSLTHSVTANWRHRGSGDEVVFSGLWSTCRSAWLSQATYVFPWGTVKALFFSFKYWAHMISQLRIFGLFVIFLDHVINTYRDVQCMCVGFISICSTLWYSGMNQKIVKFIVLFLDGPMRPWCKINAVTISPPLRISLIIWTYRSCLCGKLWGPKNGFQIEE